MARLRVGGVRSLPAAAYVQESDEGIPGSVADLESAPGHCYSAETVLQCASPAPGVVCRDCAMAELGERWDLFKARTNAAIPKSVFYRNLDRAQGEPDEAYAKMLARQRRRDLGVL